MRKVWFAVAVVMVLLLLSWFAAAPYLTVKAIQAAAEAHDPATMSEHIDYAAVRENLKQQLKARAEREVGRADSELARLGVSFGNLLIDQTVNALVKPEVIALLFRGEDPGQTTDSANVSDGPRLDLPEIETEMGYASWNVFTVILTNPKMQGEVKVKLTRDGLGWRVTGIELPL